MDILEYRQQINEIDDQIVALLEKRMDVAAGIGEEKRRKGLPAYDAAREQEKIELVKGLAKKEEYKPYIGQMFADIMAQTRQMEKDLKGIE